MKKIAILIPCYNEELTIGNVINDFKSHIPNATIYVYDNNSTDNTSNIAKNLHVNVIPEYQQGKGNVIRSMFRDIEADYYVIVDGDDTYPAEDTLKVLQLVLDGKADMAVGDRLSSTYFSENKRAFHNLGNKTVRGLINFIFGSNVKDIMSGCRAFNKKFVKGFPVLSSGFEIETEMTIHALDKRMLIKEVPINYKDRMEGSVSKLNTFLDGFKVIATIMKLFKDYKPFMFFGIIALVLGISSFGLFVPIMIEYFNSGLVPKFPTLIICIGLGIISILMFVCGLILDTVKKYAEQFYELELNILNESNKNAGGWRE